MSLSVENLTKIYHQQTAVNHISFSLEEGEITGFLGPNGAGKSTTMKMITGSLLPTEGSIKIDGEDISKNSVEARKHIGYLPENNPLYLEMYVREYLAFNADIYKIPKSRLSYQGFGSTQPIFPLPEKNEAERAANRRVEILITEN